MIDDGAIRVRYLALSPHLDERGRRMFAAAEAKAAGYGGIAAVWRATGIAPSTIGRGLKELASGWGLRSGRFAILVAAASRSRSMMRACWKALLALIEPTERGDPIAPLGEPGDLATFSRSTAVTNQIQICSGTVVVVRRRFGEQPTKFDLVVKITTAKAPWKSRPPLLARADEVRMKRRCYPWIARDFGWHWLRSFGIGRVASVVIPAVKRGRRPARGTPGRAAGIPWVARYAPQIAPRHRDDIELRRRRLHVKYRPGLEQLIDDRVVLAHDRVFEHLAAAVVVQSTLSY
jgi:hypothetical protein